jgi:hypothetical protein
LLSGFLFSKYPFSKTAKGGSDNFSQPSPFLLFRSYPIEDSGSPDLPDALGNFKRRMFLMFQESYRALGNEDHVFTVRSIK